jgi:hypothetical protein
MALTLSQLETHLWRAADILRGSIDSGDYKHYIFGLLFFKRLSDVWDPSSVFPVRLRLGADGTLLEAFYSRTARRLKVQEERGQVDLHQPDSWLIKENRALLIGPLRKLERYGLAEEIGSGQ